MAKEKRQRLFKLTDGKMETKNGTKWKVGEKVSIQGTKREATPRLCSDTVLHAYSSFSQMLTYYDNHVSYDKIRVFEAEGAVVVRASDKVGVHDLTLTKEIKFSDKMVKRLMIAILFLKVKGERNAKRSLRDDWRSRYYDNFQNVTSEIKDPILLLAVKQILGRRGLGFIEFRSMLNEFGLLKRWEEVFKMAGVKL